MDMEKEKKTENYEIALWTKEESDAPVKKLLEKHGASITKEKPVLKMKLSFPIKKENFAFLTTIIFSIGPEKVSGLKSNLNLENTILRYFLRRAKKPSVDGRSNGNERSSESRSFFHLRSESKKAPNETLTNEALEKKIEEILK